MVMQGLDISNWKADFNPDVVSYDFLVVQTTWGAGEVTNNGIVNSVWPLADAKIQAAAKRGKKVGWMHYLRGVGAKKEAAFAVEHNKGYIGKYLSTIDWESDDNAAWGNGSYLDEFLVEFIRLTGIPPVVYTMENALSWVAPIAKKHNCALWVAQYASMNPTGYQLTPWNEGAYDCVIRQYASTGSLPGYNGALDLNKAYIDPAQWDKYANPKGASTAQAKPATQAKPAAKPAAATKPAPAAKPSTYTVRAGDNLSAIAAKFGTTWQALAAINGLANPNLIHPGQVLKLSGSAPAKPAPAKRTYTVQAGDNLSVIAAKYGTTWQALAAKNNLANPDLIHPGQVLRID